MAFITEIANYIKENYDLSKESLTIIFPNIFLSILYKK